MKSEEVENNLSEMAGALAATRDPNLVKDFLHCLFTPAEAADIAARWALVKALEQKIPQREIAKALGLSLCKITRGSKELKNPNRAFQKMLSIARDPVKQP